MIKKIKLAEDLISAIIELNPAVGTLLDHTDSYDDTVGEVMDVLDQYFQLENLNKELRGIECTVDSQ